MFLVLDACTISNLIHIVQDDSLFRLLKKSFSCIYITTEVIAEVEKNKFANLSYYDNSRESVNQLITDIRLNDYISNLDKDKYDCVSFLRKFARFENRQLKEQDGEFYCALLALYLSRWGIENLMEYNNKILFATDDSRAEQLYLKLFSTNQIGSIIDSIDLLSIFYLKGFFSKKELLNKINSIIEIYWSQLHDTKSLISEIKETRLSTRHQLCLTSLMEMVLNYEFDKISDSFHENGFKNLYQDFPKLKVLLKELVETRSERKLSYLRGRHKELSNDQLWSGHLSPK